MTLVDPALEAGGSDSSVVLLKADAVSAGYGPIPVIRDIDLEVRSGEVVALLGANGAGKTTTILTLAGELTPSSGNVSWLGRHVRSPIHQRCREGMAFVPEERSVIPGLTTAENLRLGRGGVERALQPFPELRPLLNRKAGLLSGGEQQILTLARALATQPKLLLADELSLGLAPLVVARLLEALRVAAVERGVGILLVEQQVRNALLYSDRAYVLRRGSIVLEGKSSDLMGDIEQIEATYLSAAT